VKAGAMKHAGHTLVEMITVVLILAALASIAIIRLHPGVVPGVRAEAAVRQIATGLRRARAEALLHAAANPTGFALRMEGDPPYRRYQIVNLRDSTIISEREIPAEVRCGGGRRFEFGPLGNLKESSDTSLQVCTETKRFALEGVPATGAVRWAQSNQ